MHRGFKQLLYRSLLDNLSRIHYDHTVRHARHQPDVMGDQDHGHPRFLLQIPKKRHDLRLDRHVQRRRRLVRNQKRRFAAKRHGDHDALAHAAGKGMRIFFHDAVGIGHPDPPKDLLRPFFRLFFGKMKMPPDALRNLVPDRKYRIQGSQGILKDHGQAVSAHLVQLLFAHGKQIPVIKQDRTVNDGPALL